MRKQKTLFFSSFLALGIVFFIWAWKKVGISGVAEVVQGLSLWQFFIVLSLSVLIVALWVFRWQMVLRFFKEKISWKILWRARLAGLGVSTITPAAGFGGEPAQYLIAKQKRTNRQSLIASIIIDKVLFGTINFFIILAGVILFLTTFSLSGKLRLILISAVFIIFILGFWFYFRAFRNQSFIARFFKLKTKGVEKQIHKFFNFKNPHFWGAVSISLLRGAIYLARFYFIILFLGQVIPIKDLFVAIGVMLLAGLVPIPGALGTYELSQTFVFSALGLGSGLGLAMVLIMRVFDLGLASWGLFIIFQQSLKKLRFFNGKLG